MAGRNPQSFPAVAAESAVSGDASIGGQALADAVGRLVRWVTRTAQRQRMRGPAAGELSDTDVWLLGAVVALGPLRASELATWQSVDRSTIAVQVRRLEGGGLIERRCDPDDRRARLLSATPSGRAVHDELTGAAATVFDDLLAGWPAAEREQLVRLIGRLADQVSARTRSTQRQPDAQSPAAEYGPPAKKA